MFTENQLKIFCLCVLTGFLVSILYEAVVLLRALFRCNKGKNAILGILLDILFCLLFGGVCIYVSYLLKFPSLRIYMPVGWTLGGIIYWKTLRIIVAFFEKVCYNAIRRSLKKAKSKKKLSKKVRDRI